MIDDEIIHLYFSRDENAIIETKKSYGSKLSAFAYNILRNLQDSEESVSDTYLKAWNTIPPQKPVYLYSYLNKICRFICFGKLDYRNAKKRNAEIINLSDELLNSIADKKVNDEINLTKVLEKFLDELEKENRVIFLSRYWYCQSIKEISQTLKFSQSKVKSSLHRTRAKLKKYLESEDVFI